MKNKSIYRMLEIKEELKTLYEELSTLKEEHYEKFEEEETTITITTDKGDIEKAFRIYKPDGRYVYNISHEIGLRKPSNT